MLNSKVENWFIERNLHKQDPLKQILKLYEEVTELQQAIILEDESEIIDALGDIQVVLIGLSLQLDIKLDQALADAYNVIKDRKGKLINGVFIKEEDINKGENK